jgi:hypothetical protein
MDYILYSIQYSPCTESFKFDIAMSDMVKYKGSAVSFKKDQRAALYFTKPDIVHASVSTPKML